MGKPQKMIDGWYYGAWTSVAVKSVRLGWLPGLQAAQERLGDWFTKQTVLVQVFEDIAPSERELPEVLKMVWKMDWDELLRLDTHHGARNLTSKYYSDRVYKIAEFANTEQNRPEIQRQLLDSGIKYMPQRGEGEYVVWKTILDEIPKETPLRTLDLAPWTGMPPDMLDRHTREGWKLKTPETILSGTIEGHNWLCREVQRIGWDGVRKLVHSKQVLNPVSVNGPVAMESIQPPKQENKPFNPPEDEPVTSHSRKVTQGQTMITTY